MDASILVIGSDRFRSFSLDRIRDLATFTVEVADNSSEAMPLIQAQQPDLVLIQAEQPHGIELCQQIKLQNRLAWIYCIVIDDQPLNRSDQLNREVKLLEAGADAYVWMPDAEMISSDAEREFYDRRLQVQVQAGLRRVQNHRELIRANDVLSAIALSDPLTELNNRRAFEWELPRQIQNARSRNVPISLIMMDVDYFKVINDTHGHLVGDAVLKLLSARLRHNLRFYDTPFRYGGEEFVVILSDTACQEAQRIAHRLCQLINYQPFVINETLDLSVTISAGVATLEITDDARGTSLLQRADQRLLQAKAQGRNCVVGCPNVWA
ncbi:GGDEF domain-containing response regulator [Thermocoleostomius sinensis]|uniref:Diguanylate cyclase n=1 Tax=Thermocoleostomius sinensis A174 TaxID=2016057 RepID=A0A9E8ZCD0_9CYAN|nr:diguanylate cyclase [Thermocoleostomius sinensis]WAL60670.1 diguanylate cyclase [Thermocoleostomius sinensis A174]